MKKIALTFCLVLISLFVFAQKKDNIDDINNKYKREIDVDMPFFGKGTAGLIYKKRLQNKNPEELKSAKNLRLQVGFGGHIPVANKTSIDSSGLLFLSKDTRNYNVNFAIGLEKVHFFGRFNLYYGCDLGAYYTNFQSGYGYIVDTLAYNQGFFQGYQTTTQKTGLSIIPFLGAKYRFSERFSASIESGFALSYFLARNESKPINPHARQQYSSTQTTSGIEFSASYLRFLTLNYHF